MWARDIELCLGLWLSISPFVFGYDDASLTAMALACASAIVTLALLSYWHRARRAHLGELAVGAWLVGHGWWAAFGAHEVDPASQNHLLVGLLVLMFAIIPSRSSLPPERWRDAPRADGGADAQEPDAVL